jgi:hypothetical protein
VLYGEGAFREKHLPARGSRLDVVWPGCSDTPPAVEPDRQGTARRLRGLPSTVAVIAHQQLFVARGSMTALAEHPLFAALAASRARQFDACSFRHERPLVRAVAHAWSDRVRVLLGGRKRWVRVDGRTTLSNRPASTPVWRGQRLRVRLMRCGSTLIARDIAFVGEANPPSPYEANFVADDPAATASESRRSFGFAALAAVVLLLVVWVSRARGESRRMRLTIGVFAFTVVCAVSVVLVAAGSL